MIVATAGHIDHGKTALVRALTGMETDRLEEEKRRGITIELGFAFLGDDITIIDVPGHERFIKTMAAGVSTVDLALLVVAADEGIMPQSREHLAILHLLGVPRLFVVITKIGGQNEDWLKLVEEEIRVLLPPSYQHDAQFFSCDSLSGEGVEALRRALLDLVLQLPARPDSGVFRLPVDRAFSLKGYGTVVTGTILGGQVEVGDQLVALPKGFGVRVRGLQSHSRDQDSLGAGQRAALNLIGGDAKNIERGDWICSPGAFLPTQVMDVSLQSLLGSPLLKNRDRARLHIGTSDAIGRVLLLDRDAVEPGQEALAQIVLEVPIIAARSDRFVLRRYSPLLTLGGGTVLDPLPERHRRFEPQVISILADLKAASGAAALQLKVKAAGHSGLSLMAARSFMNASPPHLEAMIKMLQARGSIHHLSGFEGGLLISVEALSEARSRILERITRHHGEFPHQPGIPQAHLFSELSADFPMQVLEFALDGLLKTDLLLDKGSLRTRSHQIRLDSELEDLAWRIEALLDEVSLAPILLEDLGRRLSSGDIELNRALEAMIAQGRVARLGDGSLWSTRSLRVAWEVVRRELATGEGKTTSELREALSCPRRYAVALLEYFDSLGKTERREDVRQPGPKFDERL